MTFEEAKQKKANTGELIQLDGNEWKVWVAPQGRPKDYIDAVMHAMHHGQMADELALLFGRDFELIAVIMLHGTLMHRTI